MTPQYDGQLPSWLGFAIAVPLIGRAWAWGKHIINEGGNNGI